MLGLFLAASLAIPTGGPHDFDFEFGNWNAQISRLVHNADGSKTWIKMHGTHNVTTFWNGKANVGVFEIDGPGGHLEGMQVRLYDPKAKTWSLTFANSSVGQFQPPSTGGFSGGRGVFYDTQTTGGKTILNRSVTTMTSSTSYRDEGAASTDGGKTWEVNWIVVYTRAKGP